MYDGSLLGFSTITSNHKGGIEPHLTKFFSAPEIAPYEKLLIHYYCMLIMLKHVMPKWINKVNESSKSQTKKEKLISEINEVTNECNRMADIILQKLVLVDNKYSDPDEILFSGMAEVIDK